MGAGIGELSEKSILLNYRRALPAKPTVTAKPPTVKSPSANDQLVNSAPTPPPATSLTPQARRVASPPPRLSSEEDMQSPDKSSVPKGLQRAMTMRPNAMKPTTKTSALGEKFR